MASMHPTRIPGRWREGFALDYHTISSDFIGHDEYGHPRFDTKRSELGDLLYRLKYSGNATVVDEIVDAVVTFFESWVPKVELVLPVPPSKARLQQPVLLLAEALGRRLNLPVASGAIVRIKTVPELKDVHEYGERVKLLTGMHTVESSCIEGKRILLFDDLFRSGATMNAITDVILDSGKASDLYALTITRTRSNA